MTANVRRKYKIKPITINGTRIKEIIIDLHYEEKHGDSINDPLILELVFELDGRTEAPEMMSGQYSYFATLIEKGRKGYRLIWLLEDGAMYVGVVNAYRERRKK